MARVGKTRSTHRTASRTDAAAPATAATAPPDIVAAVAAAAANLAIDAAVERAFAARPPRSEAAAPHHPTPLTRGDPSNTVIRIAKPTGRIKRLMEALEDVSANGSNLETFVPQLVESGRVVDAYLLVRFLASSDASNVFGLDVWLGALAAALGRHDEARGALASRGEATWSKYFEASQHIAAQHPNAALWLAREAVRREPQAAPALMHLAHLEYAAHESRAALATLARLDALEPLHIQAIALRADCRLRAGMFAEARADAAFLVASAPETCDFRAMLAAVYAEAGEHEAARAACRAIPEKGLRTLSGVRALIHAACRMGDAPLMHRCLDHIVDTCYNEEDGYAQLIEAYAMRGEIRPAVGLARLATALVASTSGFFRTCGDLLTAAGLHKDAADAYADAMAQGHEDDPALGLLRAQALQAAGDLKGAGAAFKAVLKDAPQSLPALRGLVAVMQARNAPPREWIDKLYRAHKLQPDDIAMAQAFVEAAQLPANREYRRRALDTLERMHAQAPDAPLWRTLLARALQRTDPARALALAEGVLEAVPEDSDAKAVCSISRAAIDEARHKRDFTLRTIPLPGASTPANLPSSITFTDVSQEITGVEVGKTHENRACVRMADGTIVWAPWSVCSGQLPRGAVAALKTGAAYAVPEGIARRFETLLAARVVGEATVADFCTIINKRGEAFLSGGAVRDIIADPHHGRARDVDLAVTLAPSLVRLSCGSLTGDAPGLENRPNGVVSPYPLEYFGLVKYGTVENGVVQATLDVMSMRTFGALEPLQQVRGARQPVKPVAFGPDLHADARFRDFTCNALYYDPTTRILLDPLGIGKCDAVQRRLQLCSQESITKNESLGWRYIKMRHLGYTPTERTREAMGRHFAHFSAQRDAAVWLRRTLPRVFPELAEAADPKAWVDDAVALLEQDGVGDAALYEALRRIGG